ncbi:MAG: ATPase [Muribaculaceae bacterium]|nr:ATPase [Muribaculaceae bacterium]
MKNILIADAGSTKVEWVVMSSTGNVESRITTHGLNALMADKETIESLFKKAKHLLSFENKISEIYYYGAGCATPAICNKIIEALQRVWDIEKASINVYSDLTGAARSLLGENPGIACILGTGSNSCLYDGKDIKYNVPSLGFILGDEGSGSALGKRLVADAFKGHLPPLVRDHFLEMYDLSLEEILDYTYRRPAANRFLASLVPFLKEHLWNPYVYSLVREEFILFIKRNVAMYQGCYSLPLAFTGSIAYHFSDILNEAAEYLGFKISKIEKNPMDGLISYHTDKNE